MPSMLYDLRRGACQTPLVSILALHNASPYALYPQLHLKAELHT